MRISELAAETGVPVHTLKYYLREGLLMPGEARSRDPRGVRRGALERVRLVRALVEHGGVGIAGVRAILEALAAPPPSRHEFLGVAHCALPSPGAEVPVSREAVELVAELGWQVWSRRSGRARLSGSGRRARAARRGPLPNGRRCAGTPRRCVGVAAVDLDGPASPVASRGDARAWSSAR